MEKKQYNVTRMSDEYYLLLRQAALSLLTGLSFKQKHYLRVLYNRFYLFLPSVHNSYFNRCTSGHIWRHWQCFEVIQVKTSWSKASKNCEKQGGELMFVEDKETLSFLTDVLESTMSRWAANLN